jgi:hypothetical protein
VGTHESELTNQDNLGLVLHWDGRRWTGVGALSALDAFVCCGEDGDSVDISPAGDVWALLGDGVGGGPTVVAHLDGRTGHILGTHVWDHEDVGIAVNAVAAVTPSSVWLVGGGPYEGVSGARIFHWDGKTWRRQHTSFDHLAWAGLQSLSAISEDEIWAAGGHLLARYSC